MDSFHLTVLKIEGLKEVSNSYLYIYLGANIIRVLTLEAFEINPIPVPKCILRFVVEDSQTSIPQANLSFESGIFKRLGYHWLPLFTSEDKCLKEVPEEVGLPRVLIDIQANILFPVQEMTEDSDTIEELPENFSIEEYAQSKGRLSSNGLEILELDESSYRPGEGDDVTEVKIIQMKQLYEDAVEKIRDMEEVLQAKNSTIKDLILQVNEKSEELCRVNAKNQGLTEKVEELQKEVRSLQLQIEKKIRFSIEKTSCIGIVQGNQISLEDDRERLVKKLYETECKLSAYKLKTLEEIDSKVRTYLNNKNLENFATVCQELAYKIGNKKFTVFLKSDVLYCKNDGSIKKFDYFLTNHCSQDIDLYKRRKRASECSSQNCFPSFSTIEKSNSSTAHTFFNTSKPKKVSLSAKRSITPIRRKAYSPIQRGLVSR